MLSSGKWESCCRVSHSQHIIWLQCGICITHSLPNIWRHGLVMWNRIIVLDKYGVQSDTNKVLIKARPSFTVSLFRAFTTFVSSSSTGQTLQSRIQRYFCIFGHTFWAFITTKKNALCGEQVLLSVRLSVCQSVFLSTYLPASLLTPNRWLKCQIFKNVGYGSSLQQAVGQTWVSGKSAQ